MTSRSCLKLPGNELPANTLLPDMPIRNLAASIRRHRHIPWLCQTGSGIRPRLPSIDISFEKTIQPDSSNHSPRNPLNAIRENDATVADRASPAPMPHRQRGRSGSSA